MPIGSRHKLQDLVQENDIYEDVVGEINKKLAFKDAINRANRAI